MDIPNRLDRFLALRAIAALMIVVAHCLPPRETIILAGGYDFSWLIFAPGGLYLRVFFGLSGYLIGKVFYTGKYQLTPASIWQFWRNRMVRVFPLYYFAVLVLVVLVYTDLLKIENWGYLLRICTFTYNHGLPIDFDRALWAVSTEVQFYVIAPFVYGLCRRLVKPSQVLGVMALVLIATIFYRSLVWSSDLRLDNITYWYTPLLPNLDIFLVGFLLNPLIQASTHLRHTWLNHCSPLFLLALLHFTTTLHVYYQELRNATSQDVGIRSPITFMVMPALSVVIIGFLIYQFEHGIYDQPPNQKLSLATCLQNPWRLIEPLGLISYGIFVWHMPILRQVRGIITSPLPLENFLTRLGVVLFWSIAIATVTYYLVEKPALAWRANHSPKTP
ncbi:MAG: acyltransferase [Pseudanabaenaceae cyanobacterium bins.68]|nr:acyltransferase [Pseudanabaenaceae cyanobacterium bins.68]